MSELVRSASRAVDYGETEIVALGRFYGERSSGGAFMPLEL
jgi:hypothetical protein